MTDHTKPNKPSTAVHFVAGGVAAACSSLVTCPFDVVKTRLQSSQGLEMAKRSKLGSLAFDSLKDIYVNEGPRALWRGLGPMLTAVIPARATWFAIYNYSKDRLETKFGKGYSTIHLASGVVAGGTVYTIYCPIWVVRTRLALERNRLSPFGRSAEAANAAAAAAAATSNNNMKLNLQTNISASVPPPVVLEPSHTHLQNNLKSNFQALSLHPETVNNPSYTSYLSSTQHSATPRYANAIDCAAKILKYEGIKSLYKGLVASYIGVSEGCIQLVCYEKLKNILQAKKLRNVQSQNKNIQISDVELNSFEYLAVASIAKIIACVSTYPHEVVRTRVRQLGADGGPQQKYVGFVQTLRLVAKEEGLLAWYRGMGVHLMRSVPNAAILFLVYESVVNLAK